MKGLIDTMEYLENWDQVQKRYEAFWNRENHDRPILCMKAPKDRQVKGTLSTHATLKDRWNDTEYMLKAANLEFQNTFFCGEAFPSLNPNLGPDFFAACYGTQLEYGEDTSWAVHHLTDRDVEEYKQFVLQQQGYYYQKMLEMTKAAVEDGKDRYLVGITDIHPGADGLVAMRGPAQLCYDTIDHPEFISRGAMDLFQGFQVMYNELYSLTTKYQKGSTNWMGIWHPGRWYVTSCDFCCMISEDMFEEMIVEELNAELNFLDASIFHLDGPGALKHLDRLLRIDSLKGIQWVFGAGQPSASHWLEVLKKIQKAGKLIQVTAEPEELDILLENLEPEGVMYMIYPRTEEDARALLKRAESYQRMIF